MNTINLAGFIDHTLLRPDASAADVVRLCREAAEHGFFSAVVNTHWVPLAAKELAGTPVAVCSIAGFPLGAVDAAVKAFEAGRAVRAGAREIDMVMNLGAFKSGEFDLVREDIAGVVDASGGALVKVIIEAALLSDEEKIRAAALVREGGAHFVKTSTGFGPPGANARDVGILRRAVGPDFGVKASAGIRTASFALDLVRAGATRIGTSAGVEIMKEWRRLG